MKQRILRPLPRFLRERVAWRWLGKGVPGKGLVDVKLDNTPARLNLTSTDTCHRLVFLCGFYERAVTERIERLRAEPGGLLVDVGANYGYFTILWCAGRPFNSAMAFEPSPSVYAELVKNIHKNGLGNVQARQLALGAVSGRVPFEVGNLSFETGWGGISLQKTAANIEVQCLPLDELLQDGHSEVTVLKIDTEGADAWVLQGCTKLLQRRAIRHIFFEENTARMAWLGIPPGLAHRILLGFGYQLECLGGSEWYARCP